jgi:hypothetical protein
MCYYHLVDTMTGRLLVEGITRPVFRTQCGHDINCVAMCVRVSFLPLFLQFSDLIYELFSWLRYFFVFIFLFPFQNFTDNIFEKLLQRTQMYLPGT